ncbi:MAG TPA: cache domain-containing protein [Pseudonocardia sp.]
MGDAVGGLVERVARLCESTIAAVEGLRGVAAELFPASGAAAVAPIADVVRPVLETPGTPLVGAGLVLAPGAVPGVGHWMEWWHRGAGGRGALRRLEPVLDARADDFYDYTQLPWFAVPRDTGARHVTGPYVDALCTTEYTLTFTMPLYSARREFLGVVGADIVVDWLERRLLPLLHRTGHAAALVNAENRVVAANRPDLVTGAVTELAATRHPLPDLPLTVLVLPDAG